MHLNHTFVGMNTANRSNKLVATWLLVGVVMTIIQFVLGGVTRLTGSGLSITEWEVITGALPPLSEQAWLNEFAKYKQTPQFQLLNFEFDLQNFKYIFFLLSIDLAINHLHFILLKQTNTYHELVIQF